MIIKQDESYLLQLVRSPGVVAPNMVTSNRLPRVEVDAQRKLVVTTTDDDRIIAALPSSLSSAIKIRKS